MKKTIFKATVLVFILSLIGKVIGFVKSMIIASSFGASSVTDAYYLANGVISDVFYAITMSVSVAFLPIYLKRKEEKGGEEAYRFSTRVVTGLGIVSLFLTLVIVVAAPLLVRIMASSYSETNMSKTILFLRILSVGIVFSLMANIFQNILNAEKVYEYAAFSSIVNSLVLISMVLIFERKIGIMSLVFATPLSYLIQFLFLKLRSRSYVSVSVKYGIWEPGVGELLSQALPILLSNATIEINQLVDRMLLVSIEEGAVTALSYSAVLFQFAAHVISIPVSTVSFTELSLACAQKDKERVRILLNRAIRLIITVCIPVLVVIFFASETIVTVVYGHGQFTAQAILQASSGLAFYAFCLIPYCIKQVVTKAFYSVQETKIPMVLGVLEVVVNIVSSIILTRFYGIAGVVMGTALASTVFCVILLVVFSQKEVSLEIRNMKYLVKLAAVTGILFIVAGKFPMQNHTFTELCVFSMAVFTGYGLMLLLFRDTLLMEVLHRMKEKWKRNA